MQLYCPFLTSPFSFLCSLHVYRLCYIFSLCICTGQLLSGYGISKGFFIIMLSFLKVGFIFSLILIFLLGVWYPMLWSSWFYNVIRSGSVTSVLSMAHVGGFCLGKFLCLSWSLLIVIQLFIIAHTGLIFM
jgi:hypothetical protein